MTAKAKTMTDDERVATSQDVSTRVWKALDAVIDRGGTLGPVFVGAAFYALEGDPDALRRAESGGFVTKERALHRLATLRQATERALEWQDVHLQLLATWREDDDA